MSLDYNQPIFYSRFEIIYQNLYILRFLWSQLPLYGRRRYLKFIGSTDKLDI